ncbi:MAG: carbohydrate kinase family protein [Lentisphaerae bacterium]|nr:carbohydrate kinase family protein [Lentisphaerota bacterium]
MSSEVDVVVAGHICLDIVPHIPVGGETLGDILRPGKLVDIGKAVLSTGGAVSNTGLALSRLGMSVKLMGKCGDDAFGRILLQKLRDEADGAETGMQVVAGETTSYTLVVVPPGIDRILLHCTGANDTFGVADIDLETVKRARLFHFGYPPLLARTYAHDGRELAAIFSAAKATGVTTSLDTSLPDPAGSSGQVNWPGILMKTLPHVDVFTPSIEELIFMLRRDTFDEMVKRSNDGDLLELLDAELVRALGQHCLELGSAVVLIKCGRLGMYVCTAGQDRLEQMGRAKPRGADWCTRECFEVSYQVDEVVSAAGSGDNAIGGFLAAILRGCSLEDALHYACAVGAHNVQVLDAVSGVRSWAETTQCIQRGWAKNVSILF